MRSIYRSSQGKSVLNAKDKGLLREDGFTLIEVLVAIMVMGLLFPLILEGFGLALNVASRSSAQTFAVVLAKEHMARAALSLNEGEEGSVIYRGKTFNWEVVKNSSEIQGLQEIAVVITWQGKRQVQRYELMSLFAEARHG